MIILICFFGVSAFALFRQWISDKEHINQMEYEHLTSEVDKLKGQITPKFLSQTLSNASVIVESNPERASELLMQLGQLLRYQLYDCNRERVLLKSEIGFLGNFLQLKQMNKSDFKYEIIINGDLNNIFVSPMLFISLIQDMIEDSTLLSLTFTFENSSLLFLCKSDSQKKLFDDEVYLIKRRLELQYPKHVLLLEEGIIELRMEDLK
jgi:LytS/YehU family sensor histidine kinase